MGVTATPWVVRSHREHVVVCMAPAGSRGRCKYINLQFHIILLAREVRGESWNLEEQLDGDI